MCSPWRFHNTKPDDPARKAKGREYKYWPQERKDAHKLVMLKRGWMRKRKLLERGGGKCIICGYNKCQRALAFHYRDPTQKKFQLSVNFLWSKTMKELDEEFKKCDILCVRCLAELQDGVERSINYKNKKFKKNKI